MKTKVLLIQPEYKDTWAAPPLGLGYVASALRNAGNEVFLEDLTLNPLSKEGFKDLVRALKPDIIAISLMVRALPQVKLTIGYIKEIGNIPVVIGGPQPTIVPEFTLQYTGADFAVVGEGEITIVELAAVLSAGSGKFDEIEGVAFKGKDGKIQVNKRRNFIKNLDDIAPPAWDLISPLKYKLQPALTPVKNSPIAPIITTRGCPYECSFCAGPTVWKRTFRMRSAEKIVDEIAALAKQHNVRQIFLSDDNFTLSKDHAIRMCKELISRKINLPWACPNGIRIDKVDDELLSYMKKAGCYLVGFGIESGNQEILDRAHKQLDLKRVSEVIKMATRHKMIAYGFFVLGLPGETKATIKQTIDFAKRLPLDRAWFNVLVPYPGTEVFDMYSKGKSYFEIDWGNIDANTGMISEGLKYDDLTGEELVFWQRKALKDFYLSSPKRTFSVLSNMSLGSIKTLMKTSFFKHWVSRKND
ncbi:MAG: radical SAM protein [Candidatus Omnitrophica bacterium]|nr:radical SAM protein [Candidatus Omnitrophota bacterium]